MPELPEVETIKRQLAEEIVGKKLKGIKEEGNNLLRPPKYLILNT